MQADTGFQCNLGSSPEMITLGISMLVMTLFQKRREVSTVESSLRQSTKMGFSYLATTARQVLKLVSAPGDKEVIQSIMVISQGLEDS